MDNGNVRVLVAVVVLGAFIVVPTLFGPSDEPSIEPSGFAKRATSVPRAMTYSPPNARASIEEYPALMELGEEYAGLLDAGEHGIINDLLLQAAAQAAQSGDRTEVAGVLSLLGQLALEEQDFDSSELYLLEALEIYEQLGEPVGAAQIHLHLGRMHVKRRQRARVAGNAYDRLLLARWQLSSGHYVAAEDNLRLVIDENLSINRIGAAAGAFESLTSLYAAQRDDGRHYDAALRTVELLAASGQRERAESIVAELDAAGFSPADLDHIENIIEERHHEFEDSVRQIARADDYDRLFNHLRAQGDEEDAWRLRLKASDSLRQVSKRAMYRRLPDVLALLYVSNTDIEQAKHHLGVARATFEVEGRDDLRLRTERLSDEIY
ncbi:MAG: hypothetical protein AAF493_01960 [Pseudomonadota bacterium]